MATRRIKDITTTATTFASDDFIALDGATQGTRKMDKDDLIAEVSAGVSGDYLEEANNLSDVASLDTSKLNMEIPDVGTAPNEVPLNGMLGDMAYQSSDGVSMASAEVETLEVTGDATVDGTVYMAANKALNMGGASQLYYNNSTLGLQFTGSAGNNTVFIEASSGNVKLSGDETELQFNSDTGVGNNVRARIQCEGKTGTYGYGGDLVFKTTADDNTSAERVRITSDGDLGLGVTPVHDANRTTLEVKGTWGGKIRNQFGSTHSSVWYNNTSAYTYFGTETAQPLILQTDGTERINIDQYGALNIKSVGGVSAAQFPSGVSVNGITAMPAATGTPFIVGRDTGSLRSAHFAGNLKFDSGYGIDFGSNANAPGATSELLDDWETGTWSPVFAPEFGSFTSVTMVVHNAKYTKIGNRVTATCYINTNGLNTSGGTGHVRINGLPFSAIGFNAISVGYAVNWIGQPAGGYTQDGTSYLILANRTTSISGPISAGNVSDLNTAAGQQNNVMISVTYTTS